jgi:hypothetical protein
VGYARDLWSEAPTLFSRGSLQAGERGSGAAGLQDPAPTGNLSFTGPWGEPDLLAEIEIRANQPKGKVRHWLYRGVREDL